MQKRALMLIPLLLLACGKDDDDGNETGDIDTEDTDTQADSGDTDSGDTNVPCIAEVIEITPEDGEDNVFYRDALSVAFTEDASAASFALTEGTATVLVDLSVSWGEDNLMATLTPSVPLNGSSSYSLTVGICETSTTAMFETSEYGQPIDGGNETLIGLTSVILFENVNFTQPENIGSLLALYFDVPFLVGILGADGSKIDVVAAMGYFHNVDGYKQRINQSTWSFGEVDLDGNAFFSGSVPEIDLGYNNVSIPVYDFGLTGTFAPDGSHFAGGTLSGNVDTRHMAPLFGETNASAACDLVGSMGVNCEACPDGETYCLAILGVDIVSDPVPDVTLVEVSE
jgi:hypothetical protein